MKGEKTTPSRVVSHVVAYKPTWPSMIFDELRRYSMNSGFFNKKQTHRKDGWVDGSGHAFRVESSALVPG
jgi:hypothetical protein